MYRPTSGMGHSFPTVWSVFLIVRVNQIFPINSVNSPFFRTFFDLTLFVPILIFRVLTILCAWMRLANERPSCCDSRMSGVDERKYILLSYSTIIYLQNNKFNIPRNIVYHYRCQWYIVILKEDHQNENSEKTWNEKNERYAFKKTTLCSKIIRITIEIPVYGKLIRDQLKSIK